MVRRCNGPRSAWRLWGTIRDRGDRSRRRSSSASGSRRRLPGSIPVACAASPARAQRPLHDLPGRGVAAGVPACGAARTGTGNRGRVVRRRGVGGRAVAFSRQRAEAERMVWAVTASAYAACSPRRPPTRLRRQRFVRGSSVVGSASRSRRTLSAKSSSSVRITRSFDLRRSRSRRRRASAPTTPETLGHSAATTTRTPRASRAIHGQLTIRFYATGRVTAARAASTRARAAQPSRWSLTRPIACMKA